MPHARRSGRVILVGGEPGIGKTAFLDECAARIGLRVYRGVAEEIDRHIPLSLVRSCFGVRGDAAGGWAMTEPSAADRERLAAEAVLGLVEDWCAATPVALLVDDVHWADPVSLRVLARIARQAGQLPLLVLVAHRPGELALHGERITLGPLSGPEVERMIAGLVGTPPGELLDLVAGAAGNPLYITECVAALTRDGSAGPGELPASLAEAIRDRLAFLSPPARAALRVAAVLGAEFDVGELALLLDRPAVALLDVITESVHCGVLVESGERMSFRHGLIRAALRESVPRSARRAVHRQAAAALATAGAPVLRVAEHLRAGGTLDAEAVRWLTTAAPALVAQAPQLAAELLRQSEEPALRVELVRALLHAGSPARAEEVARAALAAGVDADREASLRWLLAQACLHRGSQRDAADEARRALAAPGLPARHAARFRGLAAYLLVLQGEHEQARVLAEELLAGDPADVDAEVYAWTVLASVRIRRHQPVEALELVERALAVGGAPASTIAPHLTRAYCLVQLDRLTDAQQAFETGMRVDESTSGAFRPILRAGVTMVRFLDGRWDEALAGIQADAGEADRLGLAQAEGGYAALIAIHRGGTESLTEEPRPTIGGRYYTVLRRWAVALATEASGDPHLAIELLHECWQHKDFSAANDAHLLCPDIARLAAALPCSRLARSVADGMAALRRVRVNPSIRATAALCAGVADTDPDAVAAAVADFHLAGRPLYEAYAQEVAAILHARAGRDGPARQSLDAARRTYAALGATWDLARVEACLRSLGIRPGPHGGRQRPRTGWAALTAAEIRVAALIADGRSNPDIANQLYLSRSTVQTHVSSILTKLGATSRLQIALSWAEHR